MLKTLLNMSISASYVILWVLALRFLMQKAPKKFSFFLWFIPLFRLLCPISFTSSVSAFKDRSHQPKGLCQLSRDGRYGGGKSPRFPLADFPFARGYSRFRDSADLRFFLRPALYSGGNMDFGSGRNAFAPCCLILQALPLCKSLFEKKRRYPHMPQSLCSLCNGIFPPRHLPSRRT